MKNDSVLPKCGMAFLGLALGGLLSAESLAAPADTTAKAVSTTNSAPAELPIPKSVFNPTNGIVKNPFFPDSTVRPIPEPVVPVAAPTISAASFHLRMISGLPGQEVVLVNNRNLAVGDAPVEVTLETNEKKWVKLLKVNPTSAVIQVVGMNQTFEIFLPQSPSLTNIKNN